MKNYFLIFLVCIQISHIICEREQKSNLRHHSSLFIESQKQKKLMSFSDSEFLNIHMIPHTHDDIGWLKTVDQYLYGSRSIVQYKNLYYYMYQSQMVNDNFYKQNCLSLNKYYCLDDIQYAGVQYIIDGVIDQLDRDPSKKFIYVEIGFFARWWNEQNDEKKQLVKNLVKNGQFEFINAGWCMNDEANPYYEDIIDQMTLGHQFVLKNFGVTPTVGWHIDPFGHSNSQAALFSQMGFDSFFFARIDHNDMAQRLLSKTIQKLWDPIQASNNSHSIYSEITYNHYSSPPGFCFDQRLLNSSYFNIQINI